ncbi:probable salivary secreted peptide [Leptopilina heterotoma]|uniref:probable salivary secreted peptide n=1 Tax=Leptopilina heterotoma TaxID=63436 RepID=UPI001CA84502|nr:probable salivary secreted peptide [Leptopilina heterotoma]
MEAKKCIFIIATFILALTVSSYGIQSVDSYSENKSHNFSTGARHWDDKLLFKTNVIEPSKWLRKVVVERRFNVTGYISQVAAYDHKNDGTGAHVALTAGGPQAQYVTLRFKSERGHGINFDVEIYGTYYPRH